jgi:hypothetical protein
VKIWPVWDPHAFAHAHAVGIFDGLRLALVIFHPSGLEGIISPESISWANSFQSRILVLALDSSFEPLHFARVSDVHDARRLAVCSFQMGNTASSPGRVLTLAEVDAAAPGGDAAAILASIQRRRETESRNIS